MNRENQKKNRGPLYIMLWGIKTTHYHIFTHYTHTHYYTHAHTHIFDGFIKVQQFPTILILTNERMSGTVILGRL